jgi:serine protease Do
MAESTQWAFPPEMQPKSDDVAFDLTYALNAVVAMRVDVVEDAFTASVLGTERTGNGVVISDDGIVLTIGYLITEADSIWLTTNGGNAVPGHALAYDQVTGLGLVMPLGTLGVAPLARVDLASADLDDDVYVIGHGGRAHALCAKVFSRREFAGYWEYLLDKAIFTVPAYPLWGGSALIGQDGSLLGIGSLLVQEALGPGAPAFPGNMYVPINRLKPIFEELVSKGRLSTPPRPWLGLITLEHMGQLVVGGISDGGPADRAGLQRGDILHALNGDVLDDLADFYRKLWASGPAGTAVTLRMERDNDAFEVTVRTGDRGRYHKYGSD